MAHRTWCRAAQLFPGSQFVVLRPMDPVGFLIGDDKDYVVRLLGRVFWLGRLGLTFGERSLGRSGHALLQELATVRLRLGDVHVRSRC